MESFGAAGDGRLLIESIWRQAEVHLYRGELLAVGVKIYLLGSHKEEICECGKKLWDSGGEGSRIHERIDHTRGGL